MEKVEAERELPPMMRRMTPSHRRRYLLMAFYYQDPLTRVRAFERAIRSVGDCEDDPVVL